MKSKVLITGASGFIGFHLIQASLSKGWEVVAAVRKNSAVQHLQALPIRMIELQYDQPEILKRQLQEEAFNYVIHAGAATKAADWNAYKKANVDTTQILCNALADLTTLQKFVFVSSLAAIGPMSDTSGIINENTTPQPVTAYGKSKLAAEAVLRQQTFPWVIIRPTAVYGPRERDLLTLIRAIVKGWDVYIGKIEQQLSFVYVKDLVDVIMQALTSDVSGEHFNISDGNCYGRYELAQMVKKYNNRKAIRMHLPYGLIKTVAYVLERTGKISGKTPVLNVEKLNELTAASWGCSIEKASNLLNYSPAYQLEQGLSETMEWYKKNQWM